MRNLLTLLLTLALVPSFAQAKNYTETAKYAVIVINQSLAPKNPPLWVTGTGSGKTQVAACTAAKKDASSKAPRGTQAKHFDCGKKI